MDKMDGFDESMSGYKAIFEDGYKAGRASVVLPHPCDGELYKSWTSSDYFAKIAEEHLEVIDAYKAIEKSGKCPTKEEQEHFFKECTDLIVATTGLMHYFGCDERMRQQYMKEVNESNAKRDGGKRFASSKKDFTDSEKESLFRKIGESNFEIGEIVKIDGGPEAGEIGIMLDPSKMNAHYTVSINGMTTVVPITWVKKVER